MKRVLNTNAALGGERGLRDASNDRRKGVRKQFRAEQRGNQGIQTVEERLGFELRGARFVGELGLLVFVRQVLGLIGRIGFVAHDDEIEKKLLDRSVLKLSGVCESLKGLKHRIHGVFCR